MTADAIEAACRPVELLIATIARLLAGCRHVAVGASSPVPGSGALLARALSHGEMRVSVLGSRRNNFFTSGGVELFDLAAQGRIDAFFLGGGQIDGHAKVKIPPETQTGQVFRLRNKGIRPVRGSVTGDLYCHVALETPVKLTARQKEILREFESINQEDPEAHSPKQKTFFDKLKAFFG